MWDYCNRYQGSHTSGPVLGQDGGGVRVGGGGSTKLMMHLIP